jgi:serine/threonine protein kinase
VTCILPNDRKHIYYYFSDSNFLPRRIILQYRAPEEFDKGYLNEKIDVFSFGNNIYSLLTGLWVFYEIDDYTSVQKELIKGELAYVDPRWKERTFIETKLVELMEKCWVYDPKERIDIFETVKQLREIKKKHERRKANNIEWKYERRKVNDVDSEHERKKLNDVDLGGKLVYR